MIEFLSVHMLNGVSLRGVFVHPTLLIVLLCPAQSIKRWCEVLDQILSLSLSPSRAGCVHVDVSGRVMCVKNFGKT